MIYVSGRVCVTIDPDDIESFDPFAVPTIRQVNLTAVKKNISDKIFSLEKFNHYIENNPVCVYIYIYITANSVMN